MGPVCGGHGCAGGQLIGWRVGPDDLGQAGQPSPGHGQHTRRHLAYALYYLHQSYIWHTSPLLGYSETALGAQLSSLVFPG